MYCKSGVSYSYLMVNTIGKASRGVTLRKLLRFSTSPHRTLRPYLALGNKRHIRYYNVFRKEKKKKKHLSLVIETFISARGKKR